LIESAYQSMNNNIVLCSHSFVLCWSSFEQLVCYSHCTTATFVWNLLQILAASFKFWKNSKFTDGLKEKVIKNLMKWTVTKWLVATPFRKRSYPNCIKVLHLSKKVWAIIINN